MSQKYLPWLWYVNCHYVNCHFMDLIKWEFCMSQLCWPIYQCYTIYTGQNADAGPNWLDEQL